jgi:hypothetical protein
VPGPDQGLPSRWAPVIVIWSDGGETRLSTVVTAGRPSGSEIPAASTTISSSSMNQDLVDRALRYTTKSSGRVPASLWTYGMSSDCTIPAAP